jgi:hypothetical protein
MALASADATTNAAVSAAGMATAAPAAVSVTTTSAAMATAVPPTSAFAPLRPRHRVIKGHRRGQERNHRHDQHTQ